MNKKTAKSAKTIKVKLVKSQNSCKSRHRLSVKGLGLKKLNDERELIDSPSVRGMINQVNYLVQVVE
jgi:large subunit ribosomal protein L30